MMKKLVSVLLLLALLCMSAAGLAENATYTITLEANGGAGAAISETVPSGGRYVLPECSFTAQDGYEFYAWMLYSSEGVCVDVLDPGAEFYDIGHDMAFKAGWVEKDAPTYTLSFDANGGSGTVGSVTARRGMSIMLPPDRLLTPPAGKVFKCWNVNGREYGSSGLVENVQSDLTVKAEWMTEGATLYTVSFAANGGSGSMNAVTVEAGAWYTLPDCGFTAPDGYEFYEWTFTAGSMTDVIDAGGRLTVNSNMTFAAKWIEKELPTYTITIDGNGGTGSMDSVTVKQGESTRLPGDHAFTAPAGKVFKCWSVNGVEYALGAMVANVQGDLVVKAVWVDCTHTKGDVVRTEHTPKVYVTAAEGHAASYTTTTVYACPVCGAEIPESQNVTEAQAAHSYADGKCTVCGYACAEHSFKDGVCSICGHGCTHENETFQNKGTQEHLTCTGNGDGTHTCAFKVFHTYKCDDCGYEHDKYIEDGSETEDCTYEKDGVSCDECGMQAPTQVKQESLEEALTQSMPEDLKKTEYNTPEKVVEALTQTAVEEGFVEEQVELIDVTLQITTDGGKTWEEVTPENFPSEGLEVEFDPPAGTNVKDYDFLVAHMITTGERAGEIEILKPTVRNGKLVVTFSSLSPVSISWKEKLPETVTLPQTGDDSMLLMWAALLALSCFALVLRKRSRA